MKQKLLMFWFSVWGFFLIVVSMIYIGPRIAVHFSEQCSDWCWGTRRVHNNEELGKKLKFELSQKSPHWKFLSIGSCTESHCFIVVVWYCFLFFYFLNINTQTEFFKKGFSWAGYTDMFPFRNMAHIFREQMVLTDSGNCFVNLELLYFHCHRRGSFTANNPRARKHLCLGQSS